MHSLIMNIYDCLIVFITCLLFFWRGPKNSKNSKPGGPPAGGKPSAPAAGSTATRRPTNANLFLISVAWRGWRGRFTGRFLSGENIKTSWKKDGPLHYTIHRLEKSIQEKKKDRQMQIRMAVRVPFYDVIRPHLCRDKGNHVFACTCMCISIHNIHVYACT